MSHRIIQIIAVLLLIGGLLLAAAMTPSLEAQREAMQVVVDETAAQRTRREKLEDDLRRQMPPHMAVATAALGSFRGLLVNVLWYRAHELKEAGKYYEANELSRWITTLQPRFPHVWSFHAWNMAYNISVATHTPEERWDWVNKGVNLLRDEGIPYNPHAIRLYRELSWIFFHKIGQFSDDMHWYYKAQLAMEWQEVLGAPNDGGTVEAIIADFRAMVESPDQLKELVADKPEVGRLVAQLKEQGFDIDERLLRTVGRLLMINYSADAGALGLSLTNVPPEADRRLPDLLTDPAHQAAWKPLLDFIRKRVLAERYNMDPVYMLELMEAFGPIDWRHPAAHGAYWAALGTRRAEELLEKGDVDLLNTYRQNIHSIQTLFRNGRLAFDPITQRVDIMPDPRFLDAYDKALDLAMEAAERGNYLPGAHTSYKSGHENLLLQAMVFTYLYGDKEKAAELYHKVRDQYGNEAHNQYSNRYTMTLEDLVIEEFRQNYDMRDNTRQFVEAMIVRALEQGLAYGRADVFNNSMELAKNLHAKFNAKAVVNPNAPQDRMRMPEFHIVVHNQFVTYMREQRLNLLQRSRIWRNAPAELRIAAYPKVREALVAQTASQELDMDRAFPAPEGFERPAAATAEAPSAPRPPAAQVERR